MSTEVLQGWVPDPFGRFEERYFSDGVATQLVRTGRVEASDQPGGSPATFARPEAAPVVRTRVVECVLVRRRPWRSGLILALAFLAVPLGCALLAPGSGRTMMLLTLAGAAVMVAVIVGGSGVSSAWERRRRPA